MTGPIGSDLILARYLGAIGQSIDYRMAEFRFPQASEDVNSAIRWVKANAATYHVDAAEIALIGESAGGFLVNYARTHAAPSSGAFQHDEHQPSRGQWRRGSLLRGGAT